ncbi:hypothetical protein GCM10009559_42200 [Pseudonocardia zijingensis]|uniref:Uncharacterized protein n=1 Tax=Pseudonocardia zijingensis TaxID=153376 RepID=A0ABN1QMB0_9PSEU
MSGNNRSNRGPRNAPGVTSPAVIAADPRNAVGHPGTTLTPVSMPRSAGLRGPFRDIHTGEIDLSAPRRRADDTQVDVARVDGQCVRTIPPSQRTCSPVT